MLSLEKVFKYSPVVLAAEGLRRKLYPYSLETDLRIAIIVDAVKKKEADPYLEWIARSPYFTESMRIAGSIDDITTVLSPKEQIVSVLTRMASISYKLGDTARSTEFDKATERIEKYKGTWDISSFPTLEPPNSPLRSITVKQVVKDILLGVETPKPLEKLESLVPKDPKKNAESLAAAIPGLSESKALTLVENGMLTVNDIQERGMKHLSPMEKILFMNRSDFLQKIDKIELEEWKQKFKNSVFGSYPEDPRSEVIQSVVRWVISFSEESNIIRVLYLSDPSVYVGSGILTPTFKIIENGLGNLTGNEPIISGVLQEITKSSYGSNSYYKLVAGRLSYKNPMRRIILYSVGNKNEWPYQAATALYPSSVMKKLSLDASAKQMKLTPYGLFSDGKFIKAADGTISGVFQTISDSIPPRIELTDTTLTPTKAVIIPLSEMIKAAEDNLQEKEISSRDLRSRTLSDERWDDQRFNPSSTLEFEIRFNDITSSMFFDFISKMEGQSKEVEYTESIVNIYSGGIRVIDTIYPNKNRVVMKKPKLYSSQNFTTGIRASVSKEMIYNNIPRSAKLMMIRERKRWSSYSGEAKIEASIVRTYVPSKNPGEDVKFLFMSYEIELEVNEVEQLSMLNKVGVRMFHSIYSTPILYTIPERNSIFQRCNSILQIKPRENEWRRVFPGNSNAVSKGEAPFSLDILASDVAAKPRNLKRFDLSSDGIGSGYTVSRKADGFTKYLFFADDGIWTLFPPASASKILSREDIDQTKYEKLLNVILIGEEIPHSNRITDSNSEIVFIPFDVLNIPEPYNITVENTNYLYRIEALKDIISIIRSVIPRSSLTVSEKKIINVGPNRDTLRDAISEVMNENLGFITDGLIFTPIHAIQSVRKPFERIPPLDKRVLSDFPDVCKYKPWDQLTIDFQVDYKEETVSVINSLGKIIPFEFISPKGTFDVSKHVNFTSKFFKDMHAQVPGVIIEFGPVLKEVSTETSIIDSFYFEPRRLRLDKTKPNGDTIAKNVFGDILDPIKEDTLLGKDFNLLRLHTNEIKRALFRKAIYRPSPSSKKLIVDIGSGKGGDINKFIKEVSAAVLVEPDKDNLTELYSRLDKLGITPESSNVKVIEGSGQDTIKIVNGVKEVMSKIQIDEIIVVMMLSLSFFFDSKGKELKSLKRTLTSIASESNTPTKFVFYTIEGNRLKNLFKEFGPDVTLGPANIKLLPSGTEVYVNIEGTIVDSYTEYFVDLDKVNFIEFTSITPVLECPNIPATYLTKNEYLYQNLFIYGEGIIRDPEPIPPTPVIDAADDFPYRSYFLPSLIEMFKELVSDISDFPNNLEIKSKDDHNILIRTFPSDYERVDAISNLFTQTVQVECRFGDNKTPREAWNILKTMKTVLKKSVFHQREDVLKECKIECNTFNPTFMSYLLMKYGDHPSDRGLRVLDPSGGWGDRLIGTAAVFASGGKNVEEYATVDPNLSLIPYYNLMGQFFMRGIRFNYRPIPFEDSDFPEGHFDISISSPPFWNLEIYVSKDKDKDSTQSTTRHLNYESWRDVMYTSYLRKMFENTRPGGHIILYISNIRGANLLDDTFEILERFGAVYVENSSIAIIPDSAEASFMMRNRNLVERFAYVWKRPEGKEIESNTVKKEVMKNNIEFYDIASNGKPPMIKDLKSNTPNSLIFETLQMKVDEEKNKLDMIPNVEKKIRELDLLNGVKKTLQTTYGAQIVTNAWLKMYEIASTLSLKSLAKDGSINVFCNAELPGAFVSALNQYFCSNDIEFNWVASSLYFDNKDALGDKFGMVKNYPDKWIMSRNMRGDVTNKDDVKNLIINSKSHFSGLENKIMLYTSDIGIGVDEDYNRQEEIHFKLNYGQVITGLGALSEGGTLIVKTFLFNYSFSIQIIALLSSLFDKLRIVKPESSRGTNSEVYLVGSGYKGIDIDLLMYFIDKLDDFSPNMSLVKTIGKKTMTNIREAANSIETAQIAQISALITTVKELSDYKIKQFVKDNESIVQSEWLSRVGMTSLKEKCKLIIKK